MQAGSGAGGGLFVGAPPELMQPSVWSVYHNDFLTAADFDTTNDWSETAILLGAGGVAAPALAADAALGVLRFTPEAAANSGSQAQLNSGSATQLVTPAAGRTIIFEARVSVATPQIQDFVIGLSETQAVDGTAGVIDGNGAWVDADCVVFYCNDADVGIPVAAYEDPTVGNLVEVGTVSAAAITNATYYRFGIKIIGQDYLEWYVDGVRQQTVTAANALTNPLCVTLTNVGDAAAETMDVDYITVAQTR